MRIPRFASAVVLIGLLALALVTVFVLANDAPWAI